MRIVVFDLFAMVLFFYVFLSSSSEFLPPNELPGSSHDEDTSKTRTVVDLLSNVVSFLLGDFANISRRTQQTTKKSNTKRQIASARSIGIHDHKQSVLINREHRIAIKPKSKGLEDSPASYQNKVAVNYTHLDEIRIIDRMKFATIWPQIIEKWEHLSPSDISTAGYLCRSNQIMPGHWVPINHAQRSSSSNDTTKDLTNDNKYESSAGGDPQSFYCCDRSKKGSASDDAAHCGVSPATASQGIFNYSSFRGDKVFNTVNLLPCHCELPAEQRSSSDVLDREQYEWKPTAGCSISEWNATLFCAVLGKRTILLVGDSTMLQTAATLTSWISSEHRKLGTSASSCADQIHFGLSDLLNLPHMWNLPDRFGLHDEERGHPYSKYFADSDPDIMVLTSGPHFRNHAEFELGIIKTLIPELVKLRATRSKPLRLAWKTVNPPHVGCAEFVKQNKLQHLLNESEYGTEFDTYDWHLLPYFDDLSMKFSADPLKIPIVDMRPLYYRPDAHKTYDCMHYCLPGPLNLFARELLTMMLTGEL